MGSIGFLGLLVWSYIFFMLAFHYCKIMVINLAICWKSLVLIITFNSKNIINYTWSAGNISLFKLYNYLYLNLNKNSASETTRKKSFNFQNFRNLYSQYNNISDDWLTWFIGFSEGDGALLYNKNNNQLSFILTQKESYILYYIQNNLKIGRVKSFNNKFYKLIVDNYKDILLLVHLFNGNLAINHRINQLSCWIKILEDKNYIDTKNNFKFIDTPINISLNDAWLSGFTDAEGCFNVSITYNKRYLLNWVIKLRFCLDQKDKIILEKINSIFNMGKVTLRNNNNYRFTITGFSNMIIIINYFNKFPLYTKKSKSLSIFSEILDIINNKEHLTSIGLNRIKNLKKTINVDINSKTGRKLKD